MAKVFLYPHFPKINYTRSSFLERSNFQTGTVKINGCSIEIKSTYCTNSVAYTINQSSNITGVKAQARNEKIYLLTNTKEIVIDDSKDGVFNHYHNNGGISITKNSAICLIHDSRKKDGATIIYLPFAPQNFTKTHHCYYSEPAKVVVVGSWYHPSTKSNNSATSEPISEPVKKPLDVSGPKGKHAHTSTTSFDAWDKMYTHDQTYSIDYRRPISEKPSSPFEDDEKKEEEVTPTPHKVKHHKAFSDPLTSPIIFDEHDVFSPLATTSPTEEEKYEGPRTHETMLSTASSLTIGLEETKIYLVQSYNNNNNDIKALQKQQKNYESALDEYTKNIEANEATIKDLAFVPLDLETMENKIITIANATNESLTKLATSLNMGLLDLKEIKTIAEVETLLESLYSNLDFLKENIASNGLVTDLIETYNLLDETIKFQKDQLNKQQNDLQGRLTTKYILPAGGTLRDLHDHVTALQKLIDRQIEDNKKQKELLQVLYHEKCTELQALNDQIDLLNEKQKDIISQLNNLCDSPPIFDEKDGHIMYLKTLDEEE